MREGKSKCPTFVHTYKYSTVVYIVQQPDKPWQVENSRKVPPDVFFMPDIDKEKIIVDLFVYAKKDLFKVESWI